MSNPRRPEGGASQKPKKKKKSRRWIGYTLLVMFGLMLGAGGVVANYLYKAYQTLPAFHDYDPDQTSVILDNNDQPIYKLAMDENRTLIKDITEIPLDVRNAFVAAEDHRFYQHKGIDLYRLGGVIVQDIKYLMGVEGAELQGASTITMQLARNAFLTLDQNINRKVQEMMIAVQLEQRYTKDEILLKYLNQVSFGYQAHGLEAAAQTYFAKSAKDLTLSEGAMLAGILPAPSAFNPHDNYETALRKRNIVLGLMVQHGYLMPEREGQIKAEPPPEPRRSQVSPTAITFTGDWYVDYVLQVLTTPALAQKYGVPHFDEQHLFSLGLKIHTALDLGYQKVADEKIKTMMPEAAKAHRDAEVPEAAVVIMNHQSGHVMAMTGGLEHDRMRVLNRATGAYRQPGSAIKPITAYLPAIDLLGWGPGTVIDDSAIQLNPKKNDLWPLNYDFKYTGLQPMRYGLEQSLNTMAVRSLQATTPQKGIEYARKLGLTTIIDASQDPARNDQNLALALGGLTKGTTVLDMTAAYGTLGSLGMRTDPVVITRIENKHGETIFQAFPRVQQVVDKGSAWLMVDIMKGSLIRGTAAASSGGFKGWPAAGKTGTTEEWGDAWFVGFTPQIVTGVWTGYDNDQGFKPLPRNQWGGYWTGAGPPTQIWTAIMTEIIKERPADWERPANIAQVEICRKSGLLPSPLCPEDDLYREWFRKGSEPKKVDDVWQLVPVIKQPWTYPGTEKSIDRFLLWEEGCGEPEFHLMINRPNDYARHPTKPWDERNLPRDWMMEVPNPARDPTVKCKPMETPPPAPPDPGTQPPGGGGTPQPPGGGGGGGILPPILPPITNPGR